MRLLTNIRFENLFASFANLSVNSFLFHAKSAKTRKDRKTLIPKS
jgi:hypothetical protein